MTINYRSCLNRHCPKCQTLAKQRWLERQCADLLDIDYWHLVFTLPHELNALAQGQSPLSRCRALLDQSEPSPLEPESVDAMMLRLVGVDIQQCPVCRRGRLRMITEMAPMRTFPLIPKATGMNGRTDTSMHQFLRTFQVLLQGTFTPSVHPHAGLIQHIAGDF